MKRYAVDANQSAIVEYARKLGFSVFITAKLGGGFPDLVLGKHGKNYLVEVKDGSKSPSARKLTAPEQKFFDEWRGQVCVVEGFACIDKINKIMVDG